MPICAIEMFSLFLLDLRSVKHSLLWIHHFRYVVLNKCAGLMMDISGPP